MVDPRRANAARLKTSSYPTSGTGRRLPTLAGAAGAGVLMALFAALAWAIFANDIVPLDKGFSSAVQSLRSPIFTRVMGFATYLASWQVVVGGTAALVIVLVASGKRGLWIGTLLVAVIGDEIIVWTSKAIFRRTRPDQTLSLMYGGTNYTGLYFDGDSLSFTESDPNLSVGTVKLSTVVRAADVGTMPADFPTLSTGARTQRPYTHGRGFDTASVRTEGGRYAYARRAASLRTWTAGGSALTDAEAAAIWNMFLLACGQWRSFGWTDPDSLLRFPNCRLGSDQIELRILGPNQNSVTMTIQELA